MCYIDMPSDNNGRMTVEQQHQQSNVGGGVGGGGGGYYSSTQDLFLQPDVRQQDSHMVMTGVQKPRKWKRLNVDTRFCDDYNVNTNGMLVLGSSSSTQMMQQPVANFNLTLPERVNEIRSMRVTHLELPLTFYNVSDSLGNNTLVLTKVATGVSATVVVPNAQYATATALVAAINTAISGLAAFGGGAVVFSVVNNACVITNNLAGAAALTVTFGSLPQGKSVPCSERYAMVNAVQSLVPTGVALNDATSANPNARRGADNALSMRPEDFYTSSQRTLRQAAAAQCLKPATVGAAAAAAAAAAGAVNTGATNSNLNLNIQDMDALPFRLGWLLGFRATTLAKLSVTVPAGGAGVTGSAFVDVNGPRYLYLVVDEFLNGNPHTFTTMLKTSQMRNNVLARVSISNNANVGGAAFGSVLTANSSNGLLVSDTRTYSNKVNLQRLNVQMVNELGVPMNLNGLDFSFCLEMECE